MTQSLQAFDASGSDPSRVTRSDRWAYVRNSLSVVDVFWTTVGAAIAALLTIIGLPDEATKTLIATTIGLGSAAVVFGVRLVTAWQRAPRMILADRLRVSERERRVLADKLAHHEQSVDFRVEAKYYAVGQHTPDASFVTVPKVYVVNMCDKTIALRFFLRLPNIGQRGADQTPLGMGERMPNPLNLTARGHYLGDLKFTLSQNLGSNYHDELQLVTEESVTGRQVISYLELLTERALD